MHAVELARHARAKPSINLGGVNNVESRGVRLHTRARGERARRIGGWARRRWTSFDPDETIVASARLAGSRARRDDGGVIPSARDTGGTAPSPRAPQPARAARRVDPSP